MYKVEQPKIVATPSDFPEDGLDEYLLLGRSNVGKSTLINTVLNRNIAYISQKPGRTRTLNFYRVDRAFYIVDAPGYGYAKKSKRERETFGEMVETYIATRGVLRHALLLVDFRHPPLEDDLLMAEYLAHHNVPFTIVATKTDKISKGRRKHYIERLESHFTEDIDVIPFSKDGMNVEQVRGIFTEDSASLREGA